METDNKLRPLYLLKLLYQHTDEDHPLSTGEIVQLMEEQYSIKTQRTRIPQDIELLERFGYEIGHYKGQSNSYYQVSPLWLHSFCLPFQFRNVVLSETKIRTALLVRLA